jgi:hypothetical protein
VVSEAASFARIWDAAEASLTPELARHVLRLRCSDQDLARMHELARQNQEGQLSDDEREELDNFIKVGDLLAILQSKARMVLNRPPADINGHG